VGFRLEKELVLGARKRTIVHWPACYFAHFAHFLEQLGESGDLPQSPLVTVLLQECHLGLVCDDYLAGAIDRLWCEIGTLEFTLAVMETQITQIPCFSKKEKEVITPRKARLVWQHIGVVNLSVDGIVFKCFLCFLFWWHIKIANIANFILPTILQSMVCRRSKTQSKTFTRKYQKPGCKLTTLDGFGIINHFPRKIKSIQTDANRMNAHECTYGSKWITWKIMEAPISKIGIDWPSNTPVFSQDIFFHDHWL